MEFDWASPTLQKPAPSVVSPYDTTKVSGVSEMSKVATTTRPLLDTASVASPHREIPGEYSRRRDSLPPLYRLIVTTTGGVYAWDMEGVTELFRSGSEGIVAARKLYGYDEMLAVADSHVVILHDTKKGMQRSYRLKGTEVPATFPQLLKGTLTIKVGPGSIAEIRWGFVKESILHNQSTQLSSIVFSSTV